MVYQEKFVAVIKVGGKVLREQGDLVTLPFGCEYEILLKNLDSRKAVVDISVDGQDVLNGSQLIVYPNSEFSLQGFLQGNHVKNKFKFIQKTKEISDHRGDRIDDGIVRVQYTFEEKPEVKKVIVEHEVKCYRNHYPSSLNCWNCINCYTCVMSPYYKPIYNHPYQPPIRYGYNTIGSSVGHAMTSTTTTGGSSRGVSNGQDWSSEESIRSQPFGNNISHCYNVQTNSMIPDQDEGITVKGSFTNQQFTYGWVGKLEENSHVIILRLKGTNSKGEDVQEPVLTNKKITCPICGYRNSSSNQYCGKCGSCIV